MPQVIQGQLNFSGSEQLGKDLGYDYPYELDLIPGSYTHSRIKEEILYRAREAHNLISNRVKAWNEIEQVVTAYIDIDDAEEEAKKKDKRRPTSIVFPYTFVVMETLLTYLTSAFLNDPILKYEGASPEDVLGAMLLEKVIRHQCIKTKVGLSLHTFLRDCLVYGFGAGAPVWTSIMGLKPYRGAFGTRDFREEVVYEGNKLNNIDPFLYLPDPSVPIQRIQDGEYVGWVEPTTRLDLMRREATSDGDIFNVKYLKDMSLQRSSIFKDDRSDRAKKAKMDGYRTLDITVHNSVDVIWMYVDLIPEEWKISGRKQPEKWLFALANDEVIISAKKLGLTHNMFPIITASPDFDGYSVLPLARAEVLYGMQETLNFLFNSHIINVIKSINDMFIADPYQVNMSDLKDPAPGKLIRLRRPSWGKGVKDVVQQFPVQDVTRGNIADSAFILEWMQRIGVVDESLAGALRQGGPERLTKSEFQGTRSSALTRLERFVKVIDMQAFTDLAYMMASHTQQLMSQEVYVDITGRWQDELQAVFGGETKARVSPFDLLIDFDVIGSGASIPSGSMDLWTQMFKILAENQGLSQQFDMIRIFEYIAQLGGAKNVSDFRMRPKVMSNEQVSRQLQAGNIMPLSEAQAGMGGGYV